MPSVHEYVACVYVHQCIPLIVIHRYVCVCALCHPLHSLQGLRKAEGSTDRMQHLLKVRDQSIQTLQQEIANYKEEAKKQRQLIQALERERDRYGKDASDAQHGCIQQMEEVKRKEMELYQLKKKIAENESKLKQQQVCTYMYVWKCPVGSISVV